MTTLYSPHIPTVHVDLGRICQNYSVMHQQSAKTQAPSDAPFYTAHGLPPHFAKDNNAPIVWPPQLAVIKADAYGHGHIQVAKALMQDGVKVFASGSIQEACDLRQMIGDAKNRPLIISLLGLIAPEDIALCLTHGIVPLIHNFAQISMLEHLEATLPIALKCNTGMARLGFNADELPSAIERLQKLPNIVPIITLSHLHSADSDHARHEIQVQGTRFAGMLHALRAVWPHIAASLGNSAGTFLAEDIKAQIGPHVCRPGIALYGCNPFAGTSLASLGQDLLPTMWVSAPIISIRTLAAGESIGYGHTFMTEKTIPVGIVACGYADGMSRALTNHGIVCVKGKRLPLIGRVAMQMFFIDLQAVYTEEMLVQANKAWLLGGPYAAGISMKELATMWGTIEHEVLCILGYNTRRYTSFASEEAAYA